MAPCGESKGRGYHDSSVPEISQTSGERETPSVVSCSSCKQCEELKKKVLSLKGVVEVLREWLAKRQCQSKPRGRLSAMKIDYDKCLYECNIDALITTIDRILKR